MTTTQTRPTVPDACALAVAAWGRNIPTAGCEGCAAVRWARSAGRSPLAIVSEWGGVETDLSCAACHALMSELMRLADPAGAVTLALGREIGAIARPA